MGSQHTCERLIEAGERLMGEYGIEGVSLRQIAADAGEKNTAAVQYHFGTRDGLVAAIMRKRMGEVDARRQTMLDEFEAEGRGADMQAAMQATVLPLARSLLEGDVDGMGYNLFLAQVHHRYQHFAMQAIDSNNVAGLQRAFTILRNQLLHIPPPVFLERRAQAMSFVIHALADRARLLHVDPPAAAELDSELFVHTLVDAAIGILTAPVSPATESCLQASMQGAKA